MSKKHRENLIWGIVLVVLGGIFLLENIGIPAWRFIWRLWPLILIFWGASKLYYGLKANKNQPEKKESSITQAEVVDEDRKDEA
ncbi:MAG: DUF5668 domain-containing protein [Acidobacteriota bacterium]|nr:DUF5668 domain-containing protein [Acidobacteriota bacterium]MDW3229679.1 DUF5668 domain-containing protein [Acidobacteriota bacterium]